MKKYLPEIFFIKVTKENKENPSWNLYLDYIKEKYGYIREMHNNYDGFRYYGTPFDRFNEDNYNHIRIITLKYFLENSLLPN